MNTCCRAVASILLVVLVGLAAPLLPTQARGSADPPPPSTSAADWTDFRLETPEGSSVSLSEFVGRKAVLLAFWATWCPHCNETVPELKKLEGGPLSDRLKLLAVDFMESGDKVAAFMKRKEIGYTVLLDSRGKVARMYGVVGIPTYVVVSRQGKIVYRGFELPRDISTYLE